MKEYVFISPGARHYFSIYGPPPTEWFENLDVNLLGLPSLENETAILVLTPQELTTLTELQNVFALSVSDKGLFDGVRNSRKTEAFSRALRVAQSTTDLGIAIPSLWRSYSADSLISIQSNGRATGERARLLFDRRTCRRISCFCFGTIGEGVDLESTAPPLPNLAAINEQLEKTLSETPTGFHADDENEAFVLAPTEQVLGLGHSLSTWYESKLTNTQRRFVDFQLTKSVRLRGPAGSGKTVSLVVKLLRQLQADRDAGNKRRYSFLTHGAATLELIEAMIRTMVDEAEFGRLSGQGAFVYFGTLYDLAYKALAPQLRGINPISLDGNEGKELQKELLFEVIQKYREGDWIARRGGCSQSFVHAVESLTEGNHESFCLDVLNEFACVLEPDAISRSKQKKQEYISTHKREPWKLPLQTEDERRVILDLHSGFRKEILEMEAISVDQLTADFERFLDSNAWEVMRLTEGFGAVFVDEFHLLNRAERALIPSLMCNADSVPVVVMAQDEKQDMRRVSNGLEHWQKSIQAGMESFELSEIFRYTPEIERFLRSLDEFSPTLNLAEDWPSYSRQQSKLPSGPTPTVRLFPAIREQYEAIFNAAAIAARKRRAGRVIAVLTCDYQAFKRYLKAGQHREKFFAVESRDDITLIPNRGTKFVLSMPEYVAGLQFEDVYLLDVNASGFGDGENLGLRDKRKGLSQVYLGASRAMQNLHICGTKDEGGFPPFIQHALQKGDLSPG